MSSAVDPAQVRSDRGEVNVEFGFEHSRAEVGTIDRLPKRKFEKRQAKTQQIIQRDKSLRLCVENNTKEGWYWPCITILLSLLLSLRSALRQDFRVNGE